LCASFTPQWILKPVRCLQPYAGDRRQEIIVVECGGLPASLQAAVARLDKRDHPVHGRAPRLRSHTKTGAPTTALMMPSGTSMVAMVRALRSTSTNKVAPRPLAPCNGSVGLSARDLTQGAGPQALVA